ncbi:MAG TPA: hypothetical protein VF269_03280 [Rhodanobacteraceae bacterium]
MLLNIVLQLVNASLIKLASSHPYAKMPWIAVILAIVLTLGFARLVVWNAMHKRFPVSIAYPAMALFFPCLVVLAYVYGESVSGMQMAGACLVTLGVLLLLGKASGTRDPLEASS